MIYLLTTLEFWVMGLIGMTALVGGTACSIAVRRMDRRALHSPEVQAELDREEREDQELALLKGAFMQDSISMLEFEQAIERTLRGEHGSDILTKPTSPYSTVAEMNPPPRPEDAARLVRTYSYPAAPGWPDVDPPHPSCVCGRCHKSVNRLVPTKGMCYECEKMFDKAQQQWGYIYDNLKHGWA